MEKFWSDDFDMDLLKVFPDFAAELGETADVTVWTLGHTTFGRLNHPSVWNTHGAYLWLEKPDLERDAKGWVSVGGCVTDNPLVECTWLEWLRDCWVHDFNFVMLPMGGLVQCHRSVDFQKIMYRMRGWESAQNAAAMKREEQARENCLLWLRIVTKRFVEARALLIAGMGDE